MEKKKIYGISIIRILACISVYTQHYLGMELDRSQTGLEAFRSSIWFKTIPGIFLGQLVLIAFFVLGGFLITYTTDASRRVDKEPYIKKCVYRCLNIVLPTLVILLSTAFITFVMKLLGLSDMFSLKELFKDIFKLIIGIPGDRHIYYAYPLWFQHYMLLGYIFGYVFLCIFSNSEKWRFTAYGIVLLYTLINSEYNYMVFMGMFAGELCSMSNSLRIRNRFRSKGLCITTMLIVMAVMAFLYDLDYDRIIVYGPAAFFISILLILVCWYDENMSEKNKINPAHIRFYVIIDWMAKNTYSCYLIHFFVFCSVMRLVYSISLRIEWVWAYNMRGCTVMYIIMTITVWLSGMIFTRMVLNPLKRVYDQIWSLIS